MNDSSQNVPKIQHIDPKFVQDIKIGKPLDYSSKSLRTVDKLIDETPLSVRVHGVPGRGANKKFISGAIWLNNNHLTSLQGLNKSVEQMLELPSYLIWIDVSYNEFKTIGQEFLHFQNLRILYMHGNQINDILDVIKLKSLLKLRTLTLHGNPISRLVNYRALVLFYLSQIKSLDFSLITRQERSVASPITCNTVNKVN
ncbi:PREDICTED: leucine-rich repeat-containing protein 51-like [Diuraphis noxia]|uniref:leucine-rich repeat-containing protein 51-like n=1 Tax=Diuraphis noxia TaxID=143948 RepID=UPI0007639206|nr:PREDICTED: leucine-rich repeat-containing protein 51-like [Diuraphis noxia]